MAVREISVTCYNRSTGAIPVTARSTRVAARFPGDDDEDDDDERNETRAHLFVEPVHFLGVICIVASSELIYWTR